MGDLPKSLTTIPEKLTQRILDNCDYPSIATLHKVNKSLRDFIDETVPKCTIYKLRMNFYEIGLSARTQYAEGDLLDDEEGVIYTIYKSKRQNTLVCSDDRTHWLKKTNVVVPFFNDMLQVLKHQKGPMECLTVEASSRTVASFSTGFLKKIKREIQAKELYVDRPQSFNFEKLLLLMDSRFLRKIGFRLVAPAFTLTSRVLASEQWKQCKELSALYEIVFALKDILHFTNVDACVSFLSIQDVINLKEAFLFSGPPMHYQLSLREFLQGQNDPLGPAFASLEGFQWFYCAPGITDQVLRVTFRCEPFGDERVTHVTIKFIPRSEVPRRAVVQGEAGDQRVDREDPGNDGFGGHDDGGDHE